MYTSEGTDIQTYNKCTNTQGPNFNKVPFPSVDPSTGLPVNAFQLKILADGDVLVADSDAILELDPSGNLIQTYPCSSLPNCSGQLFALSVDPSGTSFWTADSASGAIYQINIATGAADADDPDARRAPVRALGAREPRGGHAADRRRPPSRRH